MKRRFEPERLEHETTHMLQGENYSRRYAVLMQFTSTEERWTERQDCCGTYDIILYTVTSGKNKEQKISNIILYIN